MFRRILHASDFSPASRPAFVTALELAAAGKARLLLVHVLDLPRPWTARRYATRVYEQVLDQERTAAVKRLDTLVARAKRRRVVATPIVVAGDPREEVVALARAKRADLIVVGTRGEGGMERLLLGSVAQRVAETAPCAVLIVR